jgi:PAS domain S-box-containing protein
VSAATTAIRRRILLVDDDQDEHLIVGDLLRSLRVDAFDLTWRATYGEGLEALLSSRFDVCLVDYRLGERTGLDFLDAAAAACCPTPIVLLTGVGDRDVDLMATTRGAADYLVKGQITPELLERSIRYAIERARVLTALRASEGALRGANERFELAARASGIGVWEWDLSSDDLRWDDQMYRIYGRLPMAGVEPYSLWATSLHAEDRERSEREINEALRDGTNFDYEFRIVQPSGEIRHLKAAAQTQYNSAGLAIRMIGVNFDITARKQAELALKETSSLLRRVLDSTNDLSIIATSPDHTIRVFNKASEDLLGYASAELIDSATAVAFHDAAEVEARGLEMSTLLGRPVQGAGVFTDATTLDVPRQWTFIRKDQRRVPVLLKISAMFDDSGTLRGYLGVARDITRDLEQDRALREAKSQAERANAAKSEFLANMSHEIRTPLNSVIGLGYLLEQTSVTEEQRSFLRKINFAGRSLLSVINNVLDISKIEAGEMLLEDGTLDLKHLVQGIAQMLTPSAHAKGIALAVQCTADLPSQLRGDATRLGQIATNLVNNAIKFTHTGQVEIKLSCPKSTDSGPLVRLSVRDSGIGIGPEGLARLFKPFSQADTSTTRRFGGTGLGLSIARRLVDLMGGQIGVMSTVGVGSEFWVEIPLRLARSVDPVIDPALPATAAKPLGAHSLTGMKILVVDDCDINCEVAQLILRRHGATVATSGTGAEALERLRQTPDAFEIVLMDVQMPGMDGIEATRRIRTELHLTLPIIALTAGALVSERERSLQAGMNDFLTKPFEPIALIGIVRRYLDMNAQPLENVKVALH